MSVRVRVEPVLTKGSWRHYAKQWKQNQQQQEQRQQVEKKDEHNSLKFKMDASSVVPAADDGAGQHRIRRQRRKQQ